MHPMPEEVPRRFKKLLESMRRLEGSRHTIFQEAVISQDGNKVRGEFRKPTTSILKQYSLSSNLFHIDELPFYGVLENGVITGTIKLKMKSNPEERIFKMINPISHSEREMLKPQLMPLTQVRVRQHCAGFKEQARFRITPDPYGYLNIYMRFPRVWFVISHEGEFIDCVLDKNGFSFNFSLSYKTPLPKSDLRFVTRDKPEFGPVDGPL